MENRFFIKLLAVLLPVALILASFLAGCTGRESPGASAESAAGTAGTETAAPAETAVDNDTPEELPGPTDSGEDLTPPTEENTTSPAETPEELEPTTEAPEETSEALVETTQAPSKPAVPEGLRGPMPFVRVLDLDEKTVMVKAETYLYAVPRRDGEKIGLLWAHQGLSVQYGATVRTEDGAESDWYLVCACDSFDPAQKNRYGNSTPGWVPAEALTAYDPAAELPKNAAFSLDYDDIYFEDGQRKTLDDYLSYYWDNCWFLTGTDAATGRLNLINWEGRHIQLQDREALRPYPCPLPLPWTNAPEALPDPEGASDPLPELSMADFRSMVEQDSAEQMSLSEFTPWGQEWGGQTRFEGLFEPVGDRYRVKVTHTVQLTASAAELDAAAETGWLRLNGSWYLYYPGENGERYSRPPDLPLINYSSYGYVHAYPPPGFSRPGYEVTPMGEEFFFVTGVDRFSSRLEKVTGTWLLWLDPDTLVEHEHTNYCDAEGNHTTIAPLKDFGTLWGSSDVHPRFDEDGNFSIYYFSDGK